MEKTLKSESHTTEEKYKRLKADLKSMGSVLVAFSGGVILFAIIIDHHLYDNFFIIYFLIIIFFVIQNKS